MKNIYKTAGLIAIAIIMSFISFEVVSSSSKGFDIPGGSVFTPKSNGDTRQATNDGDIPLSDDYWTGGRFKFD